MSTVKKIDYTDPNKQDQDASTPQTTAQQLSTQGDGFVAPIQSQVNRNNSQQKGSGRFTSLNKYLAANQGRGQEIGQEFRQKVQDRTKDPKSAIQSTKDKVTNVIDKGKTATQYGQGISEQLQDPEFDPRTVDQAQFNTFLGRNEEQNDMFDQQAAIQALGDAESARLAGLEQYTKTLDNLASDDGLSNIFGTGNNNLGLVRNALLRHEAPDVLSESHDELTGLIDRAEELDTLYSGDDGFRDQISNLSDEEIALQQNIPKQATDFLTNLEADYGSRISEEEAARADEISKAQSLLNTLETGEIDPNFFGSLADFYKYTQDKLGVDLRKTGLKKNVFREGVGTLQDVLNINETSPLTLENVISEDEASKLNALGVLAGNPDLNYSPEEIGQSYNFDTDEFSKLVQTNAEYLQDVFDHDFITGGRLNVRKDYIAKLIENNPNITLEEILADPNIMYTSSQLTDSGTREFAARTKDDILKRALDVKQNSVLLPEYNSGKGYHMPAQGTDPNFNRSFSKLGLK